MRYRHIMLSLVALCALVPALAANEDAVLVMVRSTALSPAIACPR